MMKRLTPKLLPSRLAGAACLGRRASQSFNVIARASSSRLLPQTAIGPVIPASVADLTDKLQVRVGM